jgi:hypothetical protein
MGLQLVVVALCAFTAALVSVAHGQGCSGYGVDLPDDETGSDYMIVPRGGIIFMHLLHLAIDVHWL